MTETTDKERDLKVAVDSLKHSCLRLNKYQHRATVDIEDVELVLTELEAERQRADDAERANRNQYRDLVAGQESQKQLEAEISALKGDQVPVGKFAGWGLYRADTDSFGNWLKDNPREETDHAIAKNGYVNVRLFTAPQKPVVLPIDEMSYKDACKFVSINGMRNEDRPTLAMRVWNSCRKSAIEAAGGIVKDGE